MEVETIEAAKRMVERKLGFSFLPQISVTEEIRQRKLMAIEIVNAEPLRRNVDVVYPRHRALSGDAQSFLRLLQAAAATAVPASGAVKPRRRKKSPSDT